MRHALRGPSRPQRRLPTLHCRSPAVPAGAHPRAPALRMLGWEQQHGNLHGLRAGNPVMLRPECLGRRTQGLGRAGGAGESRAVQPQPCGLPLLSPPPADLAGARAHTDPLEVGKRPAPTLSGRCHHWLSWGTLSTLSKASTPARRPIPISGVPASVEAGQQPLGAGGAPGAHGGSWAFRAGGRHTCSKQRGQKAQTH